MDFGSCVQMVGFPKYGHICYCMSVRKRLFCFYFHLFFFPAILFISTYFAQYFAQFCSMFSYKISYLTPYIKCTDCFIRVYQSNFNFCETKQIFWEGLPTL